MIRKPQALQVHRMKSRKKTNISNHVEAPDASHQVVESCCTMAGSIEIVCMGHKEGFSRAVAILQYPRNLRTIADMCCVGS